MKEYLVFWSSSFQQSQKLNVGRIFMLNSEICPRKNAYSSPTLKTIRIVVKENNLSTIKVLAEWNGIQIHFSFYKPKLNI